MNRTGLIWNDILKVYHSVKHFEIQLTSGCCRTRLRRRFGTPQSRALGEYEKIGDQVLLNIEIDEKNGIAILTPDSKLSEKDFKSVISIIDPYIEKSGKLSGLIISTETFPGWESFSDLIAHLSFVKNHHKKIKQVAFVTNSPIGSLAESIGSHFVSAKIKNFKFSEFELAKTWIISNHDE